jgi:small subunit ribosomal protein S10
MAKATKKAEKQEQRIRIKLRAYDNKIIDKSARQIADTIERHGGIPVGPVPLPTEISKFTVNRASFIDKHSREQFEMRVHKRLIDIKGPTPKIIEALTNLALPAGVDIEIKM